MSWRRPGLALTLVAGLAGCATGSLPGQGDDGDDDQPTIDAALIDADPLAPDGAATCGGGKVTCDGDCIDPLTDDLHCGASGDCSGVDSGLACAPNAPCTEGVCTLQGYSPVGPQEDVDPALLTGWTLCYQENFGTTGTTIASILAACSGTDLMLACRATGVTNLQVLAWAPEAMVTTDTGGTNNGVVTNANGTAWYFSNSWSWGFAAEGATVAKQSCDTELGTNRMCWHTSGSTMSSGYRCGDQTALSSGYDRLAYTR